MGGIFQAFEQNRSLLSGSRNNAAMTFNNNFAFDFAGLIVFDFYETFKDELRIIQSHRHDRGFHVTLGDKIKKSQVIMYFNVFAEKYWMLQLSIYLKRLNLR